MYQVDFSYLKHMFRYLTCVSSVYGWEIMIKIQKWRPFWMPSWTPNRDHSRFWFLVVIMFTYIYSSHFKTYVWIPYLCFQHKWLGNYDQNRKTAAILAAILDFGYLQESKHLNNVLNRYFIPQTHVWIPYLCF